MKQKSSYYWRQQLIWGALMMVAGILFLLDWINLLDIAQLWQYWPALLVIFGLNKLIDPQSARQFLSGLWMINFAAWFYVSNQELWGLNFYNSWPLLLIACGAGMVLEPLLNKYFIENREYGNEK